jgi:hypothetical protein
MYRYISADSWSTLFYQILKLFYVSKITMKKFSNLAMIPQEMLKMPEGYLQDSLIYSQQEIILLRWVEVSLQMVRNDPNRLGYFDKDFKDGLGFACLLQQYTARSITPLKIARLKMTLKKI